MIVNWTNYNNDEDDNRQIDPREGCPRSRPGKCARARRDIRLARIGRIQISWYGVGERHGRGHVVCQRRRALPHSLRRAPLGDFGVGLDIDGHGAWHR